MTSEHASVIERVRDLNTHDKREHYDAPRFNFQFDDLRAAVGMVQLRKLADFVTRRAALAALYDRALGLDYAARAQGMGMVFRYLLPLSGERQTDHVAAHLAAQGIDAIRPVFRPLHRYHGRADDEFPLATEAWQRHLSLPLYPALRDGDAERVTREVQQAMGMGS